MLILHVLNGLNYGGLEVLALQLIAHTPLGVQSELLNTNRSAQEHSSAFVELQRSGQLEALHQWSHSDGPLLAWRTFQLCRKRRPSALLIYPCNRPMLWLALGALLAGVPRQAVSLGNSAPTDQVGRRTWHRLLFLFQWLGVVVVPCTQAIVESLRPLPRGLRLGSVIPNGCDVQAISKRAAAAHATQSPDHHRRVLMVARLDPIKDQATLLRAFAAVGQSGWQLQLVGDGPDRPRLEALAAELGLDPAQVFLGRRSDIPELLGQADLFAFSTTPDEGFGIVMIEAMAAGLPVIASDVPACREVLMDGAAGDLLPTGHVAAWADHLAELMGSTEARQALAGRAKIHAARYDSRHTAEQWYQLLSPRSTRALP